MELVWPENMPKIGQAVFKHSEEDFVVKEQLPFSLSGEGEHLWLWVEKQGANTEWVARQLAKVAGIPTRQVGYAGLKDRQGITRQWFSVWLPGKADPDFSSVSIPGVKVLKQVRHGRKLQFGALSQNHFQVRLRAVQLHGDWEMRLQKLQQTGFPNYFGVQRFGREGRNIQAAWRWFEAGMPSIKRSERSRHLSVLRSQAFNTVLQHRVVQGNWAQAVSGDVFQLAGSSKVFLDDGDSALSQRVEEGDLHPTGPLLGEGGLQPTLQAADIEREALAPYEALAPLWSAVRMKGARRPLRVIPASLSWVHEDEQTLILSFSLPAGSYASVLVESLFDLVPAGTLK